MKRKDNSKKRENNRKPLIVSLGGDEAEGVKCVSAAWLMEVIRRSGTDGVGIEIIGDNGCRNPAAPPDGRCFAPSGLGELKWVTPDGKSLSVYPSMVRVRPGFDRSGSVKETKAQRMIEVKKKDFKTGEEYVAQVYDSKFQFKTFRLGDFAELIDKVNCNVVRLTTEQCIAELKNGDADVVVEWGYL
jgi:hypothetical protein